LSERGEARPFVDYYAEHDISPVRQDIRDLERHFERRASLYRLLGLGPLAVRGRRVLEFGPGSGHNALFTARLGPAYYELVDANPRGLAETAATLSGQYGETLAFTVVDSLVEDYRAEEPFDLVLAENLIPFQRHPSAFAQAIARSVAPEGMLVVTCIDAVSHLSEVARRLVARRLAPPDLPLGERVAALRPYFAPHVATLAAMSRSLDDWILDNITHPLIGTTFSIADALAALDGEFDIVGSSPSFMTEWRWYKELFGEARAYNTRATAAYAANAINFLDYRITMPPHDPAIGREIGTTCDEVYRVMQAIEAGSAIDPVPLFARLAGLVRPLSPLTAESIEEIVSTLSSPAVEASPALGFASFFGRGTQYVSFARRVSV
jgi:SAM-dependent methyltransferase